MPCRTMRSSSKCWKGSNKEGGMSKQITIVVGAAALLLIVIGAVLYIVLQSDAPVMSDGPGMVYFYSPT
jgi:hypothetical protein